MLNDHSNASSSLSYPTVLPHTAFHNHLSPPESPPIKSSCYEHSKHNENVFCCCYPCPGTKPTSILATIGVCLMVLAYVLMGAFIFMSLEGAVDNDTAVAASKHKSEVENSAGISVLRSDTVNRLWSITENLNILYKENWTKLAAEEVLDFQEALVKSLRTGDRNYNGFFSENNAQYLQQHKWSFSTSFLYSLTLISTIGYGSVVPKTSWGKIVTIVYAIVGIPLMFLYLSTTGDLLARSFKITYAKIFRVKPKKMQCPCSRSIKVPVFICLVVILIYISSGAVIFHRLENWTILEGSYFCFTSLGTIGFGDLRPGKNIEELSISICSAYIFTGMAIIAMCFNLVQDQLLAMVRFLSTKGENSPNLSTKEQVQMTILGS